MSELMNYFNNSIERADAMREMTKTDGWKMYTEYWEEKISEYRRFPENNKDDPDFTRKVRQNIEKIEVINEFLYTPVSFIQEGNLNKEEKYRLEEE